MCGFSGTPNFREELPVLQYTFRIRMYMLCYSHMRLRASVHADTSRHGSSWHTRIIIRRKVKKLENSAQTAEHREVPESLKFECRIPGWCGIRVPYISVTSLAVSSPSIGNPVRIVVGYRSPIYMTA